MADTFTKSKCSDVMSKIRSRGNKDTEIVLAKLFRRHKITGWRRHFEIRIKRWDDRIFKVRSDFVFQRARLALFVDGCFWHGCPQHGTKPKSNRAFWRRKFSTNIARDQLVNRTLRRSRWTVLRIWEHELPKLSKASTPHPGPLPDQGGEGKQIRRIKKAAAIASSC